MPIKVYKPTSPGRRNSSVLDFTHLSKKRPEKSLVQRLKNHAGRNQPRSLRLNMTRTATQILHCCITPTARSATFWLRVISSPG